jgi:diguanylate cyclase (GGDEF)-like protein
LPLLFAIVDRFGSFVDQTVAGGYILALGMVCLLQYLVHLNRRMQTRRHLERCRLEMLGMEEELNTVQKDRTLTNLENHILREFVEQTEIDQALGLLLKRFIPNPAHGFAAFITLGIGGSTVGRSRGLSEQSCCSLKLSDELKDRVARQRAVVLADAELWDHEILGGLAQEDRGKVRQLHLIAVGEPGDLTAVLVTTSLYPAGATTEQQIELARRLMAGIAANLKRSHQLQTQEHQLRMASEMLELRSITDGRHDTPLGMLEEFIACLRDKIGTDRAALYLVSKESGKPNRALIRSGSALQKGVEARWQDYEVKVAESAIADRKPHSFDKAALERIGIDNLVRSALVAPLMQDQNTIGVICFTHSGQPPFGESQYHLVFWAAEHITDTIVRLLSHAAVQREARQDGLTELANRREFDRHLRQELELARQQGCECALLLVDLDRFKAVNDTYGHQAGDEVLRATASTLRDQVCQLRSGDRALIARYGGEEMAVLLPGIGMAGAQRVAEKIRTAVEGSPIRYQQQTIRVTLSVGIAVFAVHAASTGDLVAAADEALYEAKQAGRNCVRCSANALITR